MAGQWVGLRRRALGSVRALLSWIQGRFWLRQPESLRLRVPADLRYEIREQLVGARQLLAAAGDLEPGAARAQLSADAVRAFLGALGRVAEPSAAAHFVDAGIRRVQPSLPVGSLSDALQDFTQNEREPAHTCSIAARVELCSWIDALIDNRSERERRLERLAPLLAAGLALSALAYVGLRPKNLALGKSVSMSSMCPVMPPARYAQERAGRVVDGVTLEPSEVTSAWRWTIFAACTNQEIHPWLSVDLGRAHEISEVVVYNRSDCCWGVDDTPLSVQLSGDNQTFETVATRATPFTAEFPWRVSLSGQRARYVRLYNAASTPKSIVVSELEVYGR